MAKLEIKTSQQKINPELSTLLFGISPEKKQAADLQKQVQDIALDQLHPFRNHPFKVLDDNDMADMVESVTQFGVLVPAIARPDPNGGYELIAGHRRHHACQMAGMQTMPVLVREMDDDEATIIMVDSNLQRETLLPSERAFAYKMKLDAMKRQAGRPAKENGGQVGHHLSLPKSRDILAAQTGDSARNIQRFIRLTELVRPLLDLVDEKKLPINPAYELSFLKRAAAAAGGNGAYKHHSFSGASAEAETVQPRGKTFCRSDCSHPFRRKETQPRADSLG